MPEGSYEGTYGKVAHFLVDIAYGKGAVRAAQYDGTTNGKLFADFIREEFPDLFKRSSNPTVNLFPQYGDPSQSSRKANNAMSDIGAKIFYIPPGSPGLTPIENVFSNVKCQMRGCTIMLIY